jgi:hypothetical protein
MMTDWLAIATIAVGFIITFLNKTGEKLGEMTGEKIFTTLQKRFKGNKEAQSVLTNFSKKPERYKEALIDVVKEKAENDPSFATELITYIDIGKQESTYRITQIAKGTGNALAAGNKTSARTDFKNSNKDENDS